MRHTKGEAEGERRGRQDRAEHMACDVDRWIKRWAPDFTDFERGYIRGYHADPITPEEQEEKP